MNWENTIKKEIGEGGPSKEEVRVVVESFVATAMADYDKFNRDPYAIYEEFKESLVKTLESELEMIG